MTGRRFTMALFIVTAAVLVMASPAALRDDLARGQIYAFSRDFLDDIPKRLTGPGSFRFILQPLIAIALGSRDGVLDRRAGKVPYLLALITGTGRRRELLRSGLSAIVNVLLMGILLDAVFQWIIFRAVHPGAALILGPVLIAAPYTLARAFANRVSRLVRPD